MKKYLVVFKYYDYKGRKITDSTIVSLEKIDGLAEIKELCIKYINELYPPQSLMTPTCIYYIKNVVRIKE